jgi:membrane protease YdiL (CAAX protease family)
MTDVKGFIKGRPVLIYYVLTFAVSWGGILAVVGPGGIPGTPEDFERLLLAVILAMFAGPSLAGLLLTGLVHGRAGLHELLSRLLKWRVGVGSCAVALLTAPLVFTSIPLALSGLFPELLPGLLTVDDKVSLLLLGLATGLTTILEELGWTGFAIPRLRVRYSGLGTGLIVGVLWGAWHLLVNFWSSGSPSGGLSLVLLLHSLLFSAGILPAFRVLMVWVYDRTESLLVATLMHASLTASNRILVPSAAGMPLVIWSLVLGAALWVVVAAVAVASGGQLSQRPGRR